MDDTAQTIKLKLEVTFEVKGVTTLLSIMEAAKIIVDKANEYGTADGMVIFGRQKFPLR